MTASALETILAKLDGVSRNGTGFMAKCPAHEDRKASLKVSEGDDGRVLLHCHAGCEIAAILASLDLPITDLFRSGQDQVRQNGRGRRIGAVYRYTDEAGNLLFEAVRYEPKDFRQRRPDGKGGWVWNLNGVRLVLYGLPRLMAATLVFVCEGEKDCDQLSALGLVATTNPMGAGKWRTEYAECLRQKDVVILSDNDDPGRAHAEQVVASVFNKAASVRIVELPDLPPKGDASDWIAAGGTKEQLLSLVEATPEWAPSNPASGSPPDPGTVSAEPWDDLAPFDDPGELPDFPSALLPTWLGDFVDRLSLALQVPLALPALLALAAVAAAVAGKVAVLVRTGFVEPTNIFVAVALGPGNRKTPAYAAATYPIYAREAELIADDGHTRAQKDAAQRALQKTLDLAALAAATAKGEERTAATLQAQAVATELEAVRVPPIPRLIAGDVTEEKLRNLLAEQGGRLAVFTPEGELFSQIAGRYSQKGAASFEVYLQGHAGDPIRVDRIGRPADIVHFPALTVAATVQPTVVAGLAVRPEFRGRGLLGRFWFALPRSWVGHRLIAPPAVPDKVTADYAANLRRLLRTEAGGEADGYGGRKPRMLRPTTAAHARFTAFERAVERRLREGGDLADMVDWSSKLCGSVARLAGLLHMASHATDGEPWEVEIADDAMTAAITIADGFLVPHARAAFALMAVDPRQAAAKQVLAWIARKGCATFTRRDCHRDLARTFREPADLDAPLALLCDRGYVRRLPEPPHVGPGRRPSPTFEVNPRWDRGAGRAGGEDADRDGVDRIDGIDINRGAGADRGEFVNFVNSVNADHGVWL